MKFIYTIVLILLVLISCKQKPKTEVVDFKVDTLSVEYLNNKIRENPYNSFLFSKRAKLYFSKADFSSAIGDMKIAISLDSLIQDYYVDLSNYYLLNKESLLSKETLERGVKNTKDNYIVKTKLAEFNFFIKNYNKSIELLNEVEMQKPEYDRSFFVRGMIYTEMGDTSKAIKSFEMARQKNNNFYEPNILIGLIYANRKDTLAFQYYKDAIRIKPKSAEAYYNIAILYQEINNFDKAMLIYNKIINEIDSNYYEALFNIAYINLHAKNEFNLAIDYFKKYLNQNQKSARTWYNIGLCYEKLKNKKEAINCYEKARDMEENYEPAIDALNRIL